MGARSFDLRTADGIEAAQADLDRFKLQIDACVTRDILPWGLGIGSRQLLINKAREQIVAPTPPRSPA